jgi:[ribosomal protein S5]-alanine N-acetyltransferase
MEDKDKKTIGESFVSIFDNFGDTLSQIFNDPELKSQARLLGRSAARSAGTLAGRFKDDEVKAKFRSVGTAAQEFGQSMADALKKEFKTEKPKGKPAGTPESES